VSHQTRNSIHRSEREKERERERETLKSEREEGRDGRFPVKGKGRKERRAARARLRVAQASCLAHRLRTYVYMQTHHMGRRDDGRQSTRGTEAKGGIRTRERARSKAKGCMREDGSGRRMDGPTADGGRV